MRGSLETLREPNFETRNIRARGHLLLGGRNLYDCRQTFGQLDCRALDIRKPSRLDSFAAPLSF